VLFKQSDRHSCGRFGSGASGGENGKGESAMSIEVIESPDRKTWLAERKRRKLGASEVAAVLGINPFRTKLEFALKWSGCAGQEFNGNEQSRIGDRLQAVIGEMYTDETLRPIRHCHPYAILCNSDFPMLHATLDGEHTIATTDMPSNPAIPAPLEIKNVGARMMKHWDDDVPLYVQAQLQCQMLVSGANWGAVAAMLGGQSLVWRDFEINQTFCEHLVEVCERFLWNLDRGIMPEPEGTEAEKKAIIRAWPQADPGVTVPLPGELTNSEIAIEDCEAEIRRLETIVTKQKNKIRLAIGEAEVGVLPNGNKWTNKVQLRKAYQVHESRTRVLRKAK
jgi:putative phage-type endonuclease